MDAARKTARHSNTWWLIALVVATCFVYAPGLGGPFLFDDDPNIVRNPSVYLQNLNLRELGAAALSSHAGPLKRPVSMLSFAFDYYLHGLDPFWFKTTNLLIHILIGLALAALSRLLLRSPALAHLNLSTSRWISILVAAAWLLHPFNLTPVLYVVQRMTGLSTLFMVFGAISYTHGRLQQLEGFDKKGWSWIIVPTTLFLLLALFSKESGASLVLYLLVIEIALFRFAAAKTGDRRVLQGLWTLGIVSILVALGAYFLSHPNWSQNAYSFRPFDLAERLLTESRVVLWYLYMTLVPNISQMGLFHDDFILSRSLTEPWTTGAVLIVVTLLISIALGLLRKQPLIAFALLWFFAGHVLESTILPLELVAEHRNYLPSYGPLLAVFILLLRLSAKRLRDNSLSERNDRWPGVVTVVLVLLLSGATFVRASSWKNLDTLLANELTNHPHSPRNNYLSGWFAFQRAQTQQLDKQKNALLTRSEGYFQKALALDPRMGQAAVGLVCLYAENVPERVPTALGKLEQTVGAYQPHRGTIAALEWFTTCAGKFPQHIATAEYLAVMNAALRAARPSPTRRLDVVLQIARYFGVYRRDVSKAIDYSRQATRIAPHDSVTYLTLARWQLVDRQLIGAKKSLTKAQQHNAFGRFDAKIKRLTDILVELERNPSARIKTR